MKPGRCFPEVAAASFALAKKALVIGDTEQIPPIWSIAPAIDVGNMLAEKILSGSTQEEITEKYTAIADLGKSAAYRQRYENSAVCFALSI